jgi:hypothetical protein
LPAISGLNLTPAGATMAMLNKGKCPWIIPGESKNVSPSFPLADAGQLLFVPSSGRQP